MRDRSFLIIYIIIALILLFGSAEQRLRKAQFLSKSLYFPFVSSLKLIDHLTGIEADNWNLREELAAKTIQLQQLQNNYDKQKALSIEDVGEGYEFTIADIVSYRGGLEDRSFIINRGKLHGVDVDFPVISSNGIAGKVIATAPNYAIVLPLSHEKFKLAVMIQRNHLQGLLECDINGVITMNLLRLGADVNVGDEVVTSELSTVFPKNFSVGVISQLRDASDELHVQAIILPHVNTAMLDQVIVLHYHKDTRYETEEYDH